MGFFRRFVLLILLVLFHSNYLHAADVNTTITSTGGVTSPYGSLALAEDDDFGASAGQSVLCEYAEAMTDTTAVTINTTVPSAIEISVQSAYRHNGSVSSGAVLAPSSGSQAILITGSVNTTIRHLRINASSVVITGIYHQGSGTYVFDSIFLHGIQDGDFGYRLQYCGASTLTLFRCVVSYQGSSNLNSGIYVSDADLTVNCYFCDVWFVAGYGFRQVFGTLNTYGCVGFTQYPFSGTIGGDYNADNTSNATYQAPGASSAHNLTATNELTDPSNGDFTIKTGGTGTLIDLVATTSYDAYFPDIAGSAKNGSWADCGAFEVPSAGGGGSILPILMQYYQSEWE